MEEKPRGKQQARLKLRALAMRKMRLVVASIVSLLLFFIGTLFLLVAIHSSQRYTT
jgi:hypothetical protein